MEQTIGVLTKVFLQYGPQIIFIASFLLVLVLSDLSANFASIGIPLWGFGWILAVMWWGVL